MPEFFEIIKTHYSKDPSSTLLYQLLQENLKQFLTLINANPSRNPLPQFVVNEMQKFLQCGIAEELGFSRFRCRECNEDKFVVHSCKKRGFCPSCGGRRMCQTAANLVDKVIPDVPIRQWVVTLPMALRFAVAYNADLLSKISSIIVQEISRFYRSQAKLAGIKSPQTGAVVFLQRAGGQINLNPHFHIAFMEGVFAPSQGQQSDAQF